MEKNVKEVLVLGSNGKTGSRVIRKLTELNVPAREGSRNATPKFDWEDESTWKNALDNIESVYVTFQPDLAMPGAIEIIRKFCELSKDCGVNKLVLLSGRGEKEAEDCEDIVRNSGLKWTIVRASWFNQNFSESYLLEPVLAGLVALPVGDVKEPFIDVQDIADVVVASLTEDGHDNKLYEVTGSRLLSFREAVHEISMATGRDIYYKDITMDEYTRQMEEAHVPSEYISLISYLFTEVLDGRNESITGGVEQVLKRKPKGFSEYVKEVAASGAWNASVPA